MKTVSITLLVILAFFSNWLRAEAYKEKRSGIEFPESIDAYKRGKAAAYEAEPGKGGVTIEYRSDDAEVTIFIRALGDDPRKTSEDWIKETIAGIKVLEAQGIYTNVKFYEFAAAKERPGWKSAAFSSSSTNRFIVSYIFCKVDGGNLIKIRATTGKPENDALRTFAKKVQELVDSPSKK